jgi:hypothetical protein
MKSFWYVNSSPITFSLYVLFAFFFFILLPNADLASHKLISSRPTRFICGLPVHFVSYSFPLPYAPPLLLSSCVVSSLLSNFPLSPLLFLSSNYSVTKYYQWQETGLYYFVRRMCSLWLLHVFGTLTATLCIFPLHVFHSHVCIYALFCGVNGYIVKPSDWKDNTKLLV